MAQYEVEVVRAEKDGLALLINQVPKQVHQFELSRIIEESRRLIEHNKGRILGDGFGDEGLLFFAVAQANDAATFKMTDIAQLHTFHHLPVISSPGLPQNPE